jgi:hypothetical protein
LSLEDEGTFLGISSFCHHRDVVLAQDLSTVKGNITDEPSHPARH